jgi:hypothetical protein
VIHSIHQKEWGFSLSKAEEYAALERIEDGHILFLPDLSFRLSPSEYLCLRSDIADPKSKNVSFNPETGFLRGSLCEGQEKEVLQGMMERFARQARTLIESLLPHYTTALQWGKTSFRPVEAEGRQAASYRKDDSRLHVDAFASQPVQGRRLLRVFTNIHPEGKPRLWKVGEPFEKVAERFVPHLSQRPWIQRSLLQKLGITKGYRTLYDHMMLSLHNGMKADRSYQQNVVAEEIAFPSGSTWVVMTDKVSHAVLSGQFLCEQTFYLPPHAMADPFKSPLGILENLLQKPLV